MEQYIWQLLFFILLTIMGIAGFVIKSFWTSFLTRVDANFKTLFEKIDGLTKSTDFEKLQIKVSQLKDRVSNLEGKVNNCKSCNQ